MKGQTTIEFLLLLSVVVLLILAAITTVNDITKMQQNTTQAVRSGVENASLSLLQQFAEQRVGLQLTNVTEVDPSYVRLEVAKSDPYFSNQPSIIQVMAWNDYAGVMLIPEIRASITGPDGKEMVSSPGSEINLTITLVRSVTVTFLPPQIGNYNVTVTAIGAEGQVLKQKKVAFTVVGGGVGGSEFTLERHVVAARNATARSAHFVDTVLLPNASVRSATLELYDTHAYEQRNLSAYAYDAVFKWASIQGVGSTTAAGAAAAYKYSNSPLDVVLPQDAVISDAELVIGGANVWLDGELFTVTVDKTKLLPLLRPGSNLLNVQATDQIGTCGSLSCSTINTVGEARLRVSYYAPSAFTAAPEDIMFGIKINGKDVPMVATAMDISPYLGPGLNTINFTYVNGTFTYRLRVVTG